MSSRVRRRATALIAVLLVVPGLAACGSSEKDKASASKSPISGVSLTGSVGKDLKAKWHSKVAKPTSTKVTTLVKGDGAKIAAGDTVSTYLWVGNGSTKKVAFSDYTNGAPEKIPNGNVSPLFDKLFAGATYGSRVAAVTTPTELLGQAGGNPQLGIGANDNLVVVLDMVKKAEVSPKPTDQKAHEAPASKLPKVVVKGGKPVSLDFAGIADPALTTPVQRVVLKKGTGPVVSSSSTITVNYLGTTYKGAKPFDTSYSRGPATQALTGFIPGWQIGLAGVKVGSRVLLQIPPAFAYDAEGSGADIKGNATLWFVIDVVKAK